MESFKGQKLKKAIQRIVSAKLIQISGGKCLTVTAVELSARFQHAKIFFVPFSDYTLNHCLDFLKLNRYIIKTDLVNNLALKYAIDITFLYDESLENAMRIDKILSNIHDKDKLNEMQN